MANRKSPANTATPQTARPPTSGARTAKAPATRANGREWADEFLPHGYTRNQVDLDSGWSDGGHSEPVYRFAAHLAAADPAVVLDLGCGTGTNLVRRFAGRGRRIVGVDVDDRVARARRLNPDHEWLAGDITSAALWSTVSTLAPTLTICSGVIDRIEDPRHLLAHLADLVAPRGRLVLASTDRDRASGPSSTGPPRNPHHVAEWSFAEMTHLLEAAGFAIQSARHVHPRRYPPAARTRLAARRVLHHGATNGLRSCMVFELTVASRRNGS